jgi:hypothetical protein
VTRVPLEQRNFGFSRWRGMTVITMSRNELTRLRVLIGY